MPEKRASRWFSDDGRDLDKFGLVLTLSALSVAALSLIDLEMPHPGSVQGSDG